MSVNRRGFIAAATAAAALPACRDDSVEPSVLRVSCKEDDRGYERFNYYGGYKHRWRVTVDGEEVPKVFTADVGGGYVEAYKLNREGRAYAISRDRCATHVVRGHVRVFVDDEELFV